MYYIRRGIEENRVKHVGLITRIVRYIYRDGLLNIALNDFSCVV